MTDALGAPSSPWIAETDTSKPVGLPALPDGTFDVIVLGGGVAGVATAVTCHGAGLKVALVEAITIASGVSGMSTAKVTAAHGLKYAGLTDRFGADAARVYAAANQLAVERIDLWVHAHRLSCGWRRRSAYTYATKPTQRDDIEAEVGAAQASGLPAHLATELPLPFAVDAAVAVADQGELDPVAFLRGLLAAVADENLVVIEGTRALDVHAGEPCNVRTDRGELRGQHVIVATHHPFLDRGGLFARMSPQRSYALGVRLERPAPLGMFYSADEPIRSLRSQLEPDGRELFIVGGEGHTTGADEDERRRYAVLAEWAREHFPVTSIDYHWSAQDPMPADGLPFIGQLLPGEDRIHVATGFAKWGFTNGVAAGAALASRIVDGEETPFGALCTPQRLNLVAALPSMVKDGIGVAAHMIGDRLRRPDRTTDDLAPGEGAIASSEQGRVAAYRDLNGVLHAVSPVCTHLGCRVRFNEAEISWDCPCHGSRFGIEGEVLEGPAVRALESRTTPRAQPPSR
jgi:glycine/D-amino acid oxidase-like deaminating enzyme/nitrite reductase/ring-hydroxylating ferredoxin subunit